MAQSWNHAATGDSAAPSRPLRRGLAVAACSTVLAWTFAAGCSASSDQTPTSARSRDLVINNVTIVDTHDGHLTPNMSVQIIAGKIVKIAPAGQLDSSGAIETVDAKGKYLVPGFNDAHAHILDLGADATNVWALMLANGVTGVRQMNGSDALLKQRQEGSLTPPTWAPAILAMPGAVLMPTNAYTVDDAVKEVDKQKAEGADFIKVILVPPPTFFAIGKEAQRVGLPFEGHLPKDVDPLEASAAGYRSIEHLGPMDTVLTDCSTDEQAIKQASATRPLRRPPPLPDFVVIPMIRKLVQAPILGDVSLDKTLIGRLQHVVDTYDEAKCRKVAQTFAANGTWHAPTLVRERTQFFGDAPEYTTDPNLKYLPPETRRAWQDLGASYAKTFTPADQETLHQFWRLQLKLARLLDEAGVPMLAGSDYSGEWEVSGFSLHEEFALLSQDGFSPLKILQMTTLNVAKFYGREATMGSVEVGRNADLVLLDGDPTQNANNLNRINAVVRDGTFYSRATLDAKLAEIARKNSPGR